jgi:hypothetical protein
MIMDALASCPQLIPSHRSSSQPLRIQDNEVPKALVIAVVDDLAKIVHELGKGDDFVAVNVMGPTDRGELHVRDLWLGICESEDLIAGRDPSGADQLAHLRQVRRLDGDSSSQVGYAAAATVVDLVPPG